MYDFHTCPHFGAKKHPKEVIEGHNLIYKSSACTHKIYFKDLFLSICVQFIGKVLNEQRNMFDFKEPKLKPFFECREIKQLHHSKTQFPKKLANVQIMR